MPNYTPVAMKCKAKYILDSQPRHDNFAVYIDYKVKCANAHTTGTTYTGKSATTAYDNGKN